MYFKDFLESSNAAFQRANYAVGGNPGSLLLLLLSVHGASWIRADSYLLHGRTEKEQNSIWLFYHIPTAVEGKGKQYQRRLSCQWICCSKPTSYQWECVFLGHCFLRYFGNTPKIFFFISLGIPGLSVVTAAVVVVPALVVVAVWLHSLILCCYSGLSTEQSLLTESGNHHE